MHQKTVGMFLAVLLLMMGMVKSRELLNLFLEDEKEFPLPSLTQEGRRVIDMKNQEVEDFQSKEADVSKKIFSKYLLLPATCTFCVL